MFVAKYRKLCLIATVLFLAGCGVNKRIPEALVSDTPLPPETISPASISTIQDFTATPTIASVTPTIQIPTATPNGSDNFFEDFEDRVPHNFNPDPAMSAQVVQDNSGDQVFDMDNSTGSTAPDVTFGLPGKLFKNGMVEYRVRFIKLGSFNFHFKMQDSYKESYVFVLSQILKGQTLKRTELLYDLPEGADWQSFGRASYNFTEFLWGLRELDHYFWGYLRGH